jgi:uncharacterized membrane protein
VKPREQFLAQEAERLKADTILNEALAEMRRDALEDLINTDAAMMEEIIMAQAKVKAIDGLLTQLERYITAKPEA